ncbi:hypothetical protein L6164_001990 [Bauhinia variegata]|uniref:Uncharacterized protein n=1 Tax=Bauhinia variegata TaxID=167791 RepID=A0ACB9PZK4_BAUVA|nr:hypothetical protein L6164_001990 [Bauhinia variegata]
MKEGKENITKLDSHTNISFIELPHVETPTRDQLMSKSVEKYMNDLVESHKSFVEDAIVKQILPNSPKLLGLVVDLFCTPMIDVANELGLPSYLFFTCNAAVLGFMLYLPHRHDRVGKDFEKSESESIIPRYLNPVPANVLPTFAFNKDGHISRSTMAEEQRLNAFQMVKELGLAFELKLDFRRGSDDIVKGDEIAKAVKCLIEEHSEVRKRVKEMSLKSRKELIAGGSSYASVGQWIESMFASI